MKWNLLGQRPRAGLLVFLLASLPAFGVLGGSEASVQTDQSHLKASLRTAQMESYTVHELHAPTGTVVREYVAGGTVFGLAWEGPWPPDMRQLLGNYFDPYMQAREQQIRNGPPGRRPVHVELPEFVVNIAGHPGFVRGQAFVPSLLPNGVAAKDVR